VLRFLIFALFLICDDGFAVNRSGSDFYWNMKRQIGSFVDELISERNNAFLEKIREEHEEEDMEVLLRDAGGLASHFRNQRDSINAGEWGVEKCLKLAEISQAQNRKYHSLFIDLLSQRNREFLEKIRGMNNLGEKEEFRSRVEELISDFERQRGSVDVDEWGIDQYRGLAKIIQAQNDLCRELSLDLRMDLETYNEFRAFFESRSPTQEYLVRINQALFDFWGENGESLGKSWKEWCEDIFFIMRELTVRAEANVARSELLPFLNDELSSISGFRESSSWAKITELLSVERSCEESTWLHASLGEMLTDDVPTRWIDAERVLQERWIEKNRQLSTISIDDVFNSDEKELIEGVAPWCWFFVENILKYAPISGEEVSSASLSESDLPASVDCDDLKSDAVNAECLLKIESEVSERKSLTVSDVVEISEQSREIFGVQVFVNLAKRERLLEVPHKMVNMESFGEVKERDNVDRMEKETSHVLIPEERKELDYISVNPKTALVVMVLDFLRLGNIIDRLSKMLSLKAIYDKIVELAFVGAILLNWSLFVPQGLSIYRSRDVRGISLESYLSIMFVQIVTVLHAKIRDDMMFCFGATMDSIFCGMVIAMIIKFRKKESKC